MAHSQNSMAEGKTADLSSKLSSLLRCIQSPFGDFTLCTEQIMHNTLPTRSCWFSFP